MVISRFFCRLLFLMVMTGSYLLVAEDSLSDRAYRIFKDNCHRCHGVEFKFEDLNVLDLECLLAPPRADDDKGPYVTAGDPSKSRVWKQVGDSQMPPDEPLSDLDQATIKQWIESGAQWSLATNRTFVSDLDVLRSVASHLFEKARTEDRKFQRYFTLSHIHNNRKVTDEDLRNYKAALSKSVNGMSRQSSIVLPKAIDGNDTVFNIDLRHYGWQGFGVWDQVLSLYPYGLKPQNDDLREQYRKIEELYGENAFDGVPCIRADWFIAKATRPPLYHQLVNIPDKLEDLLKRFNVDVRENFKLGTSRRAGLFESGVSGQNRLIEYHSSSNGTFWISYDFQRDSRRSNLARFPLGPKFAGNPFESVAFEHAGGEIIFNLPNGLHAYMLVDGKGNRINAGPIDIVWDSKNVAGTPEIVNGLSCISCHRHGMIAFSDFVRGGNALQSAEARRKVQELYSSKSELELALANSSKDYMGKLRLVVGPYLLTGKDKDRPIEEFAEPISRVARLYDRNLDLETAARELGFEEINKLRNQVFSGRLVELGLGPLAIDGGTVKRAFWDSREASSTIFQEAATELRIGSAVNILSSSSSGSSTAAK